MTQIRKGRRSNEFKLKVALDALRGDKSLSELAEIHGVHANQISEWKKQLLERGGEIFSAAPSKGERLADRERDKLVKSIGLQQVKIDFLKKKLGLTDMEIGGL
jgi:transposase-like protein